MDFPKRLKQLRKERKMKQTDLAEILNYGYTTISNYESGTNTPAIGDIIKIAKKLDVSLDYLLGISDVKKPFAPDNELDNISERILDKTYYLDAQSRQELLDYMDWLIFRQDMRVRRVAQVPPEYKTKQSQ